ncbi:hypothetical protein E3N88_41852 [Mikania micrantha]|uniref:CCHC-type domain-containing protein n=1 Tax=Mikania micrantha TaxID=192012 RepID=A0A5N6LJE7_9ASTR|nr:hypothetical protein E3N88_41852 [Mikania micrantha]
MVEHGQSSCGYKKEIDNYEGKGKGKSKVVDLGPKKGGVKKQVFPFKGKCYNCDDLGHRDDKGNISGFRLTPAVHTASAVVPWETVGFTWVARNLF